MTSEVPETFDANVIDGSRAISLLQSVYGFLPERESSTANMDLARSKSRRGGIRWPEPGRTAGPLEFRGRQTPRDVSELLCARSLRDRPAESIVILVPARRDRCHWQDGMCKRVARRISLNQRAIAR